MAHFVRSDSPLARTAVELLNRHQPDPDAPAGTCRACGRPAPCPAALHAASVAAVVEPMSSAAPTAPPRLPSSAPTAPLQTVERPGGQPGGRQLPKAG